LLLYIDAVNDKTGLNVVFIRYSVTQQYRWQWLKFKWKKRTSNFKTVKN